MLLVEANLTKVIVILVVIIFQKLHGGMEIVEEKLMM